jgi:plastocyanin domain-containing protein
MRLTAPATTMAAALSLALLASTSCDKKTDEPTPPAMVTVAPGAVARVTIGEHGFTPASLAIAKGAAGATAQVIFLRTTDQTCAKEVVFPDLALKRDLPLDTPVTVDLPADAPRTLAFQCGMAMYKGSIVVR